MVKKGIAITVTGYEGPYGCETLRLPHFIDCWLTNDGEAVSFTCWLTTPYHQEDSSYWFLLGIELTAGP
jgi:hypothetical protein